jgi:hypothetical protein
MRQLAAGLILFAAIVTAGLSYQNSNPFVGRWDFNISTPAGMHAAWLGVSEKDGKTEVWFQPTGGNVYKVDDYKLEGSHLKLNLAPASGTHPALSWELTAEDGKLTGVQTRGSESTPLTGTPAPELNRKAPASWSEPEALFNSKNLDGWEPIGNVANNNWVVVDGDLLNKKRGANLRTVREFTDLKVHFEVNSPPDANSGFYLRGRYEVQIESEPTNENPANRRIGSVYGRIAPTPALPRVTGQWQSFDVTLVGRTVTEVANGVTVIDHKQIDGITGGALNANEGDPGPFYIQGDHTGGIKFRNITVRVPEGE